MTDSKDELEIVSTCLENDEAVTNCLSTIRESEQKAGEIAKTITQLKCELHSLQTKCENTKMNEVEICNKKKQLAEMVEMYKCTINELHKLAKLINYDVQNLDYQKIDIDINKKNISFTNFEDYEADAIAPVIILNNDSKKPNVFVYDPIHNEPKFNNTCMSICSCNKEPDTVSSDCEEDCNIKSQCHLPTCESPDNDYEKEGIRDDLMSMKGEVKLLHHQNRELLCKLNNANQRNFSLKSEIRNKSDFITCRDESSTCASCPDDIRMKSEKEILECENSRLRDELKDVKRDRCQIELARKILNLNESQCANCVGSPNFNVEIKLKELSDQHKKLLADHETKIKEIINLHQILERSRHDSKNFEDCLMVAKAQIVQLEKQLFDFNSAKTHDNEVTCSNDKYLIENLRYRLQESNDEKTNMQMVLDFHVTELEDKKLKYLAVLQTNQEQKHRIETLCKEKNTISKEYEAEFNRMNEHLHRRLEEIEKLPSMLAEAQRDYEKEKSMRTQLEHELQSRLEMIESLQTKLTNAQNKITWHEENEEEKLQLRATIKTLNDTLAENQRLYMERTHYSLQLKDHLDALREEAAIQMTKTKDFSECQRLKYTEYIQKLEQQLAECRAVACSEFKKRDHVDERLRDRIKILTKNLNEAHKQIGELFNARNLIENKAGHTLCKVPRTLKSSCKVINHPTTPEDD